MQHKILDWKGCCNIMIYRKTRPILEGLSRPKEKTKNSPESHLSFAYKVDAEIEEQRYCDSRVRITLKVCNKDGSIKIENNILSCPKNCIVDNSGNTIAKIYKEEFNRIMSRTQEEWIVMSKKLVIDELRKNSSDKEIEKMIEEINTRKGFFTMEEGDYK